MSERIQKVLSAAGIGSRRQIESWIAAGRVTVNGKPAAPGQAIDASDRISIDGRPVRLDRMPQRKSEAVIYHRPPGEGLLSAVREGEAFALEKLPQRRGLRWIPIHPMSAAEGGLELFVSDGQLAAALMREAEQLPFEFSLRARGDEVEGRLALVRDAQADDPETRGSIDLLEMAGGEGANRWVRAVVRGLRPRDLKRLFEHAGLELNRVLRTRIGPIAMDRALARGRSRSLTAAEMVQLADVAHYEPPARPTAMMSGDPRQKRAALRRAQRDKDAPPPAAQRVAGGKPRTDGRKSPTRPANGRDSAARSGSSRGPSGGRSRKPAR